MKAGHSKLDGCSATLPARRPSPRLPTLATPLPPPPSSLLCARTVALLPTAHLLQYPFRWIELRSVWRLICPLQPHLPHRFPLVKGRMVPYHALSTCAISMPHICFTRSTTAAPSSHPRPTPNTPPHTSVLHALSTSLAVSPTPSHLSQPPQPHLLCKYPLFPSP
jgi:hypothetical protein